MVSPEPKGRRSASRAAKASGNSSPIWTAPGSTRPGSSVLRIARVSNPRLDVSTPEFGASLSPMYQWVLPKPAVW